MTRAGLLLLPVLIFLSADKLPSRREADFSHKNIEARIESLRADVEAVLGSDIGPVELRISSHSVLAKLIAAQLEQTQGSLKGGKRGKALKRHSEQQADLLASGIFALVEPKTGTLHVRPATFRFIAGLSPSWRGIQSPDVLDVILAHEMVHVWQVRNRGLHKMMDKPETPAQLLGLAALIEGHAHYVARKVAARRGITWAFDLALRVQTKLPPEMKNMVFATIIEALQETFAFPYAAGLQMWETVAGRFGAKLADERLYAQPPQSVLAVEEPAEHWPGWR